jgi:hypothetical protein
LKGELVRELDIMGLSVVSSKSSLCIFNIVTFWEIEGWGMQIERVDKVGFLVL